MNERVLLVNPPGPKGLFRDTVCSTLSKASYVWKPRGHIQFSSIIPPDWDARFVDAAINGLSTEQVFDAIGEYKPTLVVVAVSSVVWDKDYEFLSRIKKEFSRVHVVAFGDAVREKYFFDMLLKQIDEVFLNPFTYDIVNYRAKKFSSFAMIEGAQGSKKNVEVKTYLPRHHLFDNISYRWPFVKHFRYAAVYTQFGCPFCCSYCTSSRTTVTYRPAENVLAEIDQVYADGYKEIHFGDDSFGNPKENTRKILEGILKKNYKISWSAYTYPALADRDYLELMKATGCHTLVTGIDSHDFSLLKKYGRPITKEILLKFLENCKELKIDVCGDFVLGFEEEDEDSILKTIDFAINCKIDYASFNSANPLFGTVIREQKIKGGIIKEGSFGYDTAGYHIPSSTKLRSERLKQLHSRAVKKFYFRPSYIIKRISKIRSFEEFTLRLIEGLGVMKNAILTR